MARRVLLAGILGMLVLGVGVRLALADPLDDEARRIAKQLQCPVCSGASVADSPSDLAGQMRGVIRARLEAGESEQQIVAYFVERYGDGVLIEPPRRGVSLLVWLAPVLVLGVGAILLWRLARSWLRPTAPLLAAPGSTPSTAHRNGVAHGPPSEPVSSVDRARAELDRFRREV